MIIIIIIIITIIIIMIIIIIIIKGSQAFAYIPNLVCVYWIGTVITSPTDNFLGSPNVIPCSFSPKCPTVNVPLVISTSVRSIAANAYYGCGTITSLVVASTVTYIGYNNFYYNDIIL